MISNVMRPGFYNVVVIGGGPAGMAAAVAANDKGARVLIIERDMRLGGILNQCIHNGFGLHYFKVELTGPEYADRFIQEVGKRKIDVMSRAFVTKFSNDGLILSVISAEQGAWEITAGAVVLAMGCRERTAGAIAIAGSRPAGVYTAGLAQKLCNVHGLLVGKKVVILGSGDIGLIMARRMSYEGAKVVMVCEVMPYSGGLARNLQQCVYDLKIPLYFSTTVAEIHGEKRVEGVTVAKLNDKGNIVESTKRRVDCDTLLLSVGLIPENDLVQGAGIEFDRRTNGAVVSDDFQTTRKGVFACGNCLHVHDLADNVTLEAAAAGGYAAEFALKKGCAGAKKIEAAEVRTGNGVRYVLPQKIRLGGTDGSTDSRVRLSFRSDNVYKAVVLNVKCEGSNAPVFTRKYAVIAPGEMQSVLIGRDKICGNLTLELEPEAQNGR